MADDDSRAGTSYLSSDILAYSNRVHAPHDEALERAFSSADGQRVPAIQLGGSEAKLLQLLLRLVRAERVVEIGALAGYSAIRCARALPAHGRLWTVEFDAHCAELTRTNVTEAGLGDRVEVVQGAALDVLPDLETHAPFDAVFIDADKVNYARYGEWAVSNTRNGGLMVADNAFLFGRLMEDSEEAAAMRRLHELVSQEYDSVCVPTPDGMIVGIKR